MNRRASLRRLAAIAGGIVLVPACGRYSEQEVLAAYKNLSVTEKENELVRMLCEIFIPSGDGIKGANDLMIEDFVMVIVNDCLDGEKQESFLNGMRSLGSYSRTILGKELNELTQEGWEDYVSAVLKTEEKAAVEKDLEWKTVKDVKYFMNTVKQFTVEGFITSKYYMTEIMPYSMAPGRFQGKVIIKEGENINIYG